ncbi:UDP-Glycosyltransferase/glycogen phosphorylase [Trametes versicolor FP-101664 SS1]|uniref:UDP-Glycosyltransferase/glycogen phosphorylase n=1 Tax=Trametes versicolor (strain FP-101664) TaxID=717944 RepID=UPI0004624937|nr:UDP-Glycosyltransferase/glycogen phosphorylase [Trametes versicolor FP-101664 SS1]EIW63121.1 UDP-Glycosyltransferase/glycogen phosphorylase [Trametes versicolor FP-101664 SS1]
MADPVQKHIVAFAYQAWGHARPLTILVSRFVKLHPVQVTLLSHDAFFERIQTELSRCFEPGEEEYAKRIRRASLLHGLGLTRVISVGSALFLTSREADENFKLVWEKLVAGEPVTCEKTKVVHAARPKPNAIIIDLFAVHPFKSIKAVSGDSVKVHVWHPALTYEMFWFWGPEKVGGRGNIRVKAEEEARLTGQPYADVAKKMSWGAKGDVVRIPEFPPLYDYEYFPQEFDMDENMLINVLPYVHETLEASDGVLLFSSETFEPGAVAAVRAWYAETSRPAYICGPLLPSGSQAATNEKKLSAEAEEIQTLLDTTLKTSGEHSLLYISFGSIFWPKAPEKLYAVLDVVMELGIPFILSHASPFAVVPDDIREKAKAYGKGIISAWTPQQMILDHPATGWFIAHGGHNGVMEAISAGVPQILWPFLADQPLNAIYMTDTLQIAYELIEVRTALGLHAIYRNGRTPVGTLDAVQVEVRDVLAKAFGADGAQKRARLLALREKVGRDWEEGGPSLRDVTAFLQSL